MIKEKSVGAIIFYLDKIPQFLLLKYNIHGHTHWDFPKGKIKDKEKPYETALREIKEETNLEDIKLINNFEFDQTYSYQKNNGIMVSKTVTFLLFETLKKYKESIELSNEHSDYKWVNFKEALTLLQFSGQKEALRKAYQFLSKNSNI